MKAKRIVAAALVATTVVSIMGCSPQQEKKRQVIEKNNKKITVLDNPNKVLYNQVALDKIETYENVRGLDWYDDGKILVSKENKKLKPVSIEGEMVFPKNLYLMDLKSSQLKAILENNNSQSAAKYSPDKKHIFYKENIEEDATGFIMDGEGKSIKKITENGAISIAMGRWVDNRQVILSTMGGQVQVADTDGKVSPVAKTKEIYVNNTFKIGTRIYYSTNSGKMMVLDTDTKQSKVIKQNVVWIIPSPDQTQLAVVKRTGETRMALYLTDLEGNEKAKLAEGTQVFGTSWSPDQKKLAYSVINENGGQTGGLFVSDVKTGRSTQMSADIQYIADPISWSPSSKEMLVSVAALKENKYKMITYAISLK